MADPTLAPVAAPGRSSPNPIAHDDLCPICHLLLYLPVKTACSHTLCHSCLSTWASTSASSHSVVIPIPIPSTSALDLDLSDFDPTFDAYTPTQLSAKCPMCRTPTTARKDRSRARELEERYPEMYRERAKEEEGVRWGEGEGERFTILMGNTHKIERGSGAEGSPNLHDWTFFVRFSRPEVVDCVVVDLHRTFNPKQVTLREPPFQVRRLGWGIFTILARVYLHEPYTFPDEDTVLSLDWMLDFTENGKQARVNTRIIKGRGPTTGNHERSDNAPSPTRWPHMDDDEEEADEDYEDDSIDYDDRDYVDNSFGEYDEV